MVCKRCGSRLPDTSTICEYCGTYQKTYIDISERAENPKHISKVKTNAVIFIIIAIFIVGVAVAATVFSRMNQNRELNKIRALYDEMIQLSEPSQNDINRFNALVGQFVVKYKDSENIAEVEEYHARINKYDSSLIGGQGDSGSQDAESLEKYLIENAKTSIFQLGSIDVKERPDSGAFDLYVNWANNSNMDISKIIFLVDAYDSSGNRVKNTDGKERVAASAASGPFRKSNPDAFYQNTWINTWPSGSEIASVDLVLITIYYENGSSVQLNENVIPYLK